MALLFGDNGILKQTELIWSNIEQSENEATDQINRLKEEEEKITIDKNTVKDTEAPIINSIEIVEKTSHSFKVKINITESGSGIKQIRYSNDNGTTWNVATGNLYEYTFYNVRTLIDEYNVVVEATDNAGNVSKKSEKLEAMKIGENVNYSPASANAYTLSKNDSESTGDKTLTQETLSWKILNINENTGKIDIVGNTTSSSIYFSGAVAYNNGVFLLNDICEKLYSNKDKNIIARSMNLGDMEKHLTTAGFSARNSYVYSNDLTNYIKYGTKKTYKSAKTYPNLYASEKGAGINTADVIQPAITNAIEPYEESSKKIQV